MDHFLNQMDLGDPDPQRHRNGFDNVDQIVEWFHDDKLADWPTGLTYRKMCYYWDDLRIIMERHEIIREAIEQAGSTYVSVDFLKKDGSFRQMTNPCIKNEIKGTGSACSGVNIFRVRAKLRESRKPTWLLRCSSCTTAQDTT